MKNVLKKISWILDYVYGWGIFICLFGGGIMFLGYVVAFIVGGELAATICSVIYKEIYMYLIYGGNVIVLFGLINMYLKKQKSLIMEK